MLSQEVAKFHEMSPADVKFDNGEKLTTMEFQRPLSQDGEAAMFSVPIYSKDTREDISNRVNFLMSVAWDRLEMHNRAVMQNELDLCAEVKTRIEKEISEYEAKDQKPPKRLVVGLEKIKLKLTGIEKVLNPAEIAELQQG